MHQSINIIIINVINERARFFNMCEIVSISIDSIIISISVFVVKRSDYELLLKRFFQRATRINFINMNNELFKMILHSLNEKKRISFLKMPAKHINNKKKINICDEIFKHLNNNLINVLAQKFKFDHHESSETKIKSLRTIHEVLFKTV